MLTYKLNNVLWSSEGCSYDKIPSTYSSSPITPQDATKLTKKEGFNFKFNKFSIIGIIGAIAGVLLFKNFIVAIALFVIFNIDP